MQNMEYVFRLSERSLEGRLCIVGLLRTRTTSSTDIMDASKLSFTPASL